MNEHATMSATAANTGAPRAVLALQQQPHTNVGLFDQEVPEIHLYPQKQLFTNSHVLITFAWDSNFLGFSLSPN